MSKPLQGSPSSKSLRSRMGTMVRRSTTAIGGLARPGTPSRSSTESLRLEANAAGPEHVMPSPVAESPAREAAESMPEPTGPSRLSGPPIVALDLTPEPTANVSSSILEPAAAAAPPPGSDAVPASVPESSLTALPKSTPEPVPTKSADNAPFYSQSPESIARELVRQDEALPVRPSDDSSSTRSHGQVVDRVSTPPLTTEAPFTRVDNTSAEVASLMLKTRTRGSTVSSQVRPRTPSIFNGRVSRRPSASSLASSAAVLSSQPVHATEPHQGGAAGMVRASSQATGDPYANPFEAMRPPSAPHSTEQPVISMPNSGNVWAAAPIDVPLPPSSEVVYAMPIQTGSNISAAGKSSVFSPREMEDDTDETRPLLQPSTSLKNLSNYGQKEPARSVLVPASQNDDLSWPIPMRRFANHGWQEILLPDGARYFSNPELRLVTDVDLRNTERLDVITTFLDGCEPETLPQPEWELWLRDARESTLASFLVKAWVHHKARMVLFERPSSDPGEIMNKDIDKSDMEYQYWSFMVSHPAHAPLPPESISKAIDVLTWSYTDRLLPSPHPSLPPFSQEECQELLRMLHSFDHLSAQTVSVVRTRIVSKVLVRVAAWRQGRLGNQCSRGKLNIPPVRVPFLRTAGDFIISFACLGLPYLFLERSHHQRFDTEGGVRNTGGPMLIVGAFACLIAAVILSASVTFITLPGIDDVSRVAGFIAILLSASSLISAVIALFRYKSDIENPIAYPRGEGLVLLSRRSVLLSLPLVFLLYAITAFITGITLYAFRGLTTTTGGHHFKDYTQWAVIGSVGALACILLTSQTLIH